MAALPAYPQQPLGSAEDAITSTYSGKWKALQPLHTIPTQQCTRTCEAIHMRPACNDV